jgi:KDO2-lipid IV(A) lauroyltransferase
MGNWEWLLVANKIYIGCEIDAVYKPLSSPFFDKLMLRIRGRLGIFPVASNRILRIETARKGITRCIAMAADQTPGHEGSFVRTFLNQPTLFFKGPQKIAEMFSYPVYYSGIRKLGRGKYQLFVEKIADAPLPEGDKILEIFADKMERDIRENPSIWLWSHKRWKHRIPEQMLETLKNKKSSSEEGTLL